MAEIHEFKPKEVKPTSNWLVYTEGGKDFIVQAHGVSIDTEIDQIIFFNAETEEVVAVVPNSCVVIKQ
jgi:elongation factor P hydroxylase